MDQAGKWSRSGKKLETALFKEKSVKWECFSDALSSSWKHQTDYKAGEEALHPFAPFIRLPQGFGLMIPVVADYDDPMRPHIQQVYIFFKSGQFASWCQEGSNCPQWLVNFFHTLDEDLQTVFSHSQKSTESIALEALRRFFQRNSRQWQAYLGAVESCLCHLQEIEPTLKSSQQLRQKLVCAIKAAFTLDRHLRAYHAALSSYMRYQRRLTLDNKEIGNMKDVLNALQPLLDRAASMQTWATTLLNLQLDLASNRTNEIMKTLTIMSALFSPAALIAGL
ncbi:MAG: hypothetical protein OWS74_07395, partial [Firmicutes bacterium]|nr:hypothetical protein [Bacillota bacterium]